MPKIVETVVLSLWLKQGAYPSRLIYCHSLVSGSISYPNKPFERFNLLQKCFHLLIHNRSILLVDEGTSALDQKNAEIVEQSMLSNPEVTLVLVSHYLTDERKA